MTSFTQNMIFINEKFLYDYENERKRTCRVKAKSTKISFSAKTYPEPEGARWKQNFSGRYEDQLSADKKSALDGLS